MRLGMVLDGGSICCLCDWKNPGGDRKLAEQMLRDHLIVIHARSTMMMQRMMTCRKTVEFHGVRWKNDLAAGRH